MRDVNGNHTSLNGLYQLNIGVINDTKTSNTTTWSSSKIQQMIQHVPTDLVVSLTQETTGQTYSLATRQNCTFTDSGGEAGDYKSNENYTVVFDAGPSGAFSVVFNSFSFEHTNTQAYDKLIIRGSRDGVDYDEVSVKWMQSLSSTSVTSTSFDGSSWESISADNGWVVPKDIARAISLGFDQSVATVFARRYISFTFYSDSSTTMPGWSIQITAIAD
jgi:hypothetical protein